MPIDYKPYLYDYDHARERGERAAHRNRRAAPASRRKRTAAEIVASLVENAGVTEGEFSPSYSASRHEAGWISDALGPFLQDGFITDVLRLVKGGKEATVYQCAADPGLGVDYLAAKVYRPRMFRNLRNDAQYRAGRQFLTSDGKLLKDGRALHAIAKGTDVGKGLQHAAWVAHEAQALRDLGAAGVDVPRLYASRHNAILMEYIGDDELPAPTLSQVDLDEAEAASRFPKLVADIGCSPWASSTATSRRSTCLSTPTGW